MYIIRLFLLFGLLACETDGTNYRTPLTLTPPGGISQDQADEIAKRQHLSIDLSAFDLTNYTGKVQIYVEATRGEPDLPIANGAYTPATSLLVPLDVTYDGGPCSVEIKLTQQGKTQAAIGNILAPTCLGQVVITPKDLSLQPLYTIAIQLEAKDTTIFEPSFALSSNKVSLYSTEETSHNLWEVSILTKKNKEPYQLLIESGAHCGKVTLPLIGTSNASAELTHAYCSR